MLTVGKWDVSVKHAAHRGYGGSIPLHGTGEKQWNPTSTLSSSKASTTSWQTSAIGTSLGRWWMCWSVWCAGIPSAGWKPGSPRANASRTDPFTEQAMKILRNAAQCLGCNDVIVSKHRPDFRTCKCGTLSVDGGLEYIRRSGTWLSVWKGVPT